MYGALLKLTAMVGVMGVGITTVYQAQQGVLTSAGDTTALAGVVSPPGSPDPGLSGLPTTPPPSGAVPAAGAVSTEAESTETPHAASTAALPLAGGTNARTENPATLNGPGADAADHNNEPAAVVQLADLNGQLPTLPNSVPERFQRSVNATHTNTTTSSSGQEIVPVAGSDEMFPLEVSPAVTGSAREGVAASPLQEEDPFGSFEQTPPPATAAPNSAAATAVGNPDLPNDSDDPFGVAPATLPATALPEDRPQGSRRRSLATEPSALESASAVEEPAAAASPDSSFDPFGAASPPETIPEAETTPESETTPLTPVPSEPVSSEPLPLQTAPIEPDSVNPNPAPQPASADPFSFGAMPLETPDAGVPAAAPATPTPAPTGTIATGELHGDGEPSASVARGVLKPQLSVEKIAPARAVVGQELVYSILIRNTGDVAAAQVLLEDRIPRGTELIGTAPQAELTGTVLKWKLGSLAAGGERKVSIKVRPLTDGAIGSVARVSFVTEVAAEIMVTTPRLDLVVTAPSAVRVGEKVDVTYRLQNTGSGDAVNVVLHTILPEGLKHPAGGDLEYSLGMLSAGESREVRLELLAGKAGLLTCDNDVTTDGGAALRRSFQVEAVGEQLLLARTAQPRLMIGRPSAVTNQVTNEGRAVVDSVEIREIIPAGLEVAEASDGGTYDPNTRSVVWTVGPLAPGEAKSVKAKLLPKVAGDHTAQVTARGKAGSVARVESPFAVVGAPALSIDALTETRLVAVGEKLVFQAELKNRGTAPARQVVLTIDVPAELELEGATGPTNYRRQGRSLVFEGLAELAPQGGGVYELTFVARKAGECRLPMQISADYLSRPLLREEPIQIVAGE